jgi:hypothetical protein
VAALAAAVPSLFLFFAGSLSSAIVDLSALASSGQRPVAGGQHVCE